ncbi:MAG: glycosyltransferase family 39 protein [Chloroflexota bacterium]|nr:glycosyltransferase family 39 protein [Chloroflexota bacterium]
MSLVLPKHTPIPGAPHLRALPVADYEKPAADRIQVRPAVALLTALLVGGLMRLTFVLSADFPLNDGGLFYAMIGDLRAASFHLPQTTSYNAADIPFTYPPLGFYFGGLLTQITPLDAFDVLRLLPLFVSIATIPAFYLLARSLLPSRSENLAATFVFALLPRGSMWMIMGGGLTRSFGLLFMILALQQLHTAYTTRRTRPVLLTMLFGGLTLLSHMEMTLLLLVGGCALFAAFGRSRDGVRRSIAIAGGALLVAAPWWMTVVARYGVSPFFAAGGSRSVLDLRPLLQIVTLNAGNEALFPLLTLLGICGLLVCLGERRWFLPVWIAAAALAEPWVLATAVTVPLALLGGVGVTRALIPFAERVTGDTRPWLQSWAPAVVLAIVIVYAAIAGLVATSSLSSALPRSERQAMAWAAENTPPSSRFLVVSGEPWWGDKASEWFPVLGQRPSVATPQGLEWLPNGRFGATRKAHELAQECAGHNSDCLTQWSVSTGVSFSHIYLSKSVPRSLARFNYDDCCLVLRSSLMQDPSYIAIYDGPGATIFVRRPAAP